jgi:hypothetical protein
MSRIRGILEFVAYLPIDDVSCGRVQEAALNSFSTPTVSITSPPLENELPTLANRPKARDDQQFGHHPPNSFSRSRDAPTHTRNRERVGATSTDQ